MNDPVAPANKYTRPIQVRYQIFAGISTPVVDCYDVIRAFDVRCPATAHALKKMLCPGQRGVKSARQDLEEAIVAIQRAIEMLPQE